MRSIIEIHEEITQLLSFTNYGKLKLETLTSQLSIFEKNLHKLPSKYILRQVQREVEIFNATLMTTSETIQQWQQKVIQLYACVHDQTSKKLIGKIKRLESRLKKQYNRIQNMQSRYQRIAMRMCQQAKDLQSISVLLKSPP